MSLARQQGEVSEGSTQQVTWRGLDDIERTAVIDVHSFTKEVFA